MKSIEESAKLKKELDLLRPLKKEDELRIMQKFRLDWNYHSNNLEGNTLTYGETKALILFGITAQGKPLQDHFEITGHDEAIKWVMEVTEQKRPMSEKFIRELHKLILKEPYEVDAITPEGQPTKKKVKIGVYKSSPNHVLTKTGEIFRFATPEETPSLMTDLIDWFKEKVKTKAVDPIFLATEFHYKFIIIHPFDDGNGRVARILMNFILLHHGYPPVIIKTDDKENYYAALRQADAGIMEPFVAYIAENLNRSLNIMIEGAKGKSIGEHDDLDKEISLLEQKLKSAGSADNVYKSKKILLYIYDNSISKLIDKFIAKAEKFEKLYTETTFSIVANFIPTEFNTKNDVLGKIRESLTKSTQMIDVEFEYVMADSSGKNSFVYKSVLRISFDQISYSISNSAGVSNTKRYSEFLEEDEMNEIINSEMKRHTESVEKHIQEANKKI